MKKKKMRKSDKAKRYCVSAKKSLQDKLSADAKLYKKAPTAIIRDIVNSYYEARVSDK